MTSMDARRLELYEMLKPKLDEGPARALVLALPPDPETLATKDDLRSLEERMDMRFEGVLARMDVRFSEMDARFAQTDAKIAGLDATLTRRMVAILGAWTILFGSALSWAIALLR